MVRLKTKFQPLSEKFFVLDLSCSRLDRRLLEGGRRRQRHRREEEVLLRRPGEAEQVQGTQELLSV